MSIYKNLCLGLTALGVLYGCGGSSGGGGSGGAGGNGGDTDPPKSYRVAIVGDVVVSPMQQQLQQRDVDVDRYYWADRNPARLSGDYVAWSGEAADSHDNVLYIQHLQQDVAKVIVSSGEALDNFFISDTSVVWSQINNQPGSQQYALYHYDIATATISELAQDNEDFDQLRSDGDYVVWMQDQSIYGMKISSGESLVLSAESGSSGSSAALTMAAPYAVWRNGQQTILGYDMALQLAFNVSDDDLLDAQPAIDGDRVVWRRDGDIYLYDISSTERTRLTDDGGEPGFVQETPQISGDYIVWLDEKHAMAYQISSEQTYDIGGTDTVSHSDITVQGNIAAFDQGSEVYIYQIGQSAAPKKISVVDKHNHSGIAISGSYVIWQDDDNGKRFWRYNAANGVTESFADYPLHSLENKLADYGALIFTDQLAEHMTRDLFTRAEQLNINMLGLGSSHEERGLAWSLNQSGRIGLLFNSGSENKVTEIIVAPELSQHALYKNLNMEEILSFDSTALSSNVSFSRDSDAANSPDDWRELALFSHNMGLAGEAAIVEFSSDRDVRFILDGASTTAQGYSDWSETRWDVLAAEINYLLN